MDFARIGVSLTMFAKCVLSTADFFLLYSVYFRTTFSPSLNQIETRSALRGGHSTQIRIHSSRPASMTTTQPNWPAIILRLAVRWFSDGFAGIYHARSTGTRLAHLLRPQRTPHLLIACSRQLVLRDVSDGIAGRVETNVQLVTCLLSPNRPPRVEGVGFLPMWFSIDTTTVRSDGVVVRFVMLVVHAPTRPSLSFLWSLYGSLFFTFCLITFSGELQDSEMPFGSCGDKQYDLINQDLLRWNVRDMPEQNYVTVYKYMWQHPHSTYCFLDPHCAL